ncbi:MAG: cytochrome P450 [Acidimicrobiales bacterium]|jgi:cytochrome P450
MTDLYWDPFSPELRDDPYPLWKRLRDEAPLYYNDRHDFWVLSRFHDIEQAHRDVEAFSSSHGTTLESMSREPMTDTGLIIALDPPRHTMLRRLVSRAFTSRRVSMLEDRIRAVCAELLDPHIGAGTFDYVQDFSAILPPTIISALLGVPEQDQEKLRHLVDDVFAIDESGIGMTGDVSKNAIMELLEYLGGQFADRKIHPRHDMFTELLQAEITDEAGNSRRLTDQELMSFGLLLFAAGSETVARHLGWVASVLPDYPDQRAELATDFSLIPNAIDEILRLEAPSPVQGRWVTKDVTIHGATIPANSRVVLVTGSAGRDERKYNDPDVLDIHRKVDLHLAFGYGVHFCLGAALARLEGRIGLEETFKRWPKWQVDRDNAVLLYTSTVRGPLNLPVYA